MTYCSRHRKRRKLKIILNIRSELVDLELVPIKSVKSGNSAIGIVQN